MTNAMNTQPGRGRPYAPPAPRASRRYLAVYLPTWPADRILRRLSRRRAGRGEPSFLLFAATSHGRRVVAACCGASARAGVRVGMSIAHATALLPREAPAMVRDHAPGEDAVALLALARWAVRFAPTSAPDHPDGLMLDVTGCQRLYGGDERLAALVAGSLRALGLEARVAVAPTIGAAWGVARFAMHEPVRGAADPDTSPPPHRTAAPPMRPVARNFAAISMPIDGDPAGSGPRSLPASSPGCGFRVVSEEEWPGLLERLPIAALRVEPRVVDELAEVGIDHVVQLLAVPREEIASRFGADVLLRLDQASGEAMEVLRPVGHEEPPSVAIRFAGPTTQLEAIEQAVRRLVEKLCDRLLKCESGVRRVELEIERLDQDLRPEFAQETLTLSRPSRSVDHLWNLLRPRIERLHLGEGVESLALTARRVAPLLHEQERLDGSVDESEATTTARLQESAGRLIDLLESRLGPSGVLAGEAVETHIPESAFRYRPASEGGLSLFKASMTLPRESPREEEAPAIGTTTVTVTSTVIPPSGDRPTVLFDKPEPAAVTLLQPEGPVIGLQWRRLHRIRTAIGPERIGRRWWHFGLSRRQPSRDYYRLQDEEGLWLWVYRSRSTRRWFVHGIWG